MSLYNEERPQSLSEVKGQPNVVSQIQGILDSGNVPNVCLFTGPRGTGKTSVARIFARELNGNNDNDMDIVELDAASNNKVEDVHRIIESSAYSPMSKYKIFIIDEVHMLSTAAFNALLKLLEEPPTYCKFILCTTEEHKVPVTIASRCRKLHFERIDIGIVAEKLAGICDKRSLKYEENAIRLIAKASEGCMRDAESLLEIFLDSGVIDMQTVSKILGTADEESVVGIVKAMLTGNVPDVCTLIRQYNSRGKNLTLLCKGVIEFLNDVLYCSQTDDASNILETESYITSVMDVVNLSSFERILNVFDSMTDLYTTLQKGGDTGLIFEAKVISVMAEESTVSMLQGTVEALSEAVFSLQDGIVYTNSAVRTAEDVGYTKPSDEDYIVHQVDNTPHSEETNVDSTMDNEPDTGIAPVESSFEESVMSTNYPMGNEEDDFLNELSSFGSDNTDFDLSSISAPSGADIGGAISLFDEPTITTEPISTDSVTPANDNVVDTAVETTDTFESVVSETQSSTESFTKVEVTEEPYQLDSYPDVFDIPIMNTIKGLL